MYDNSTKTSNYRREEPTLNKSDKFGLTGFSILVLCLSYWPVQAVFLDRSGCDTVIMSGLQVLGFIAVIYSFHLDTKGK